MIDTNPAHWFKGMLPLVTPSKDRTVSGHEPFASLEVLVAPAKAEELKMTFGGFLKDVGKAFEKGLLWAVQYAVPVEKLVAILFPAAAPEALGIANATGLIQTAVIAVEQKYAASGVQSGTGPQKAAEVLLLTGNAVISLLKQDGITADGSYVSTLVDAVVAILNVQTLATTAVSPAGAK